MNRYYVVMSDGQRYGPATIPHLNDWIREGRVLPDTILEDTLTGNRVTAQTLHGLDFSLQAHGQAPPVTHQHPGPVSGQANYPMAQYSPYTHPTLGPSGSGTSSGGMVVAAYVLGAIALLALCMTPYQLFLAIGSLVFAIVGRSRSESGSGCALGFGLTVLVLAIAFVALMQWVSSHQLPATF